MGEEVVLIEALLIPVNRRPFPKALRPTPDAANAASRLIYFCNIR